MKKRFGAKLLHSLMACLLCGALALGACAAESGDVRTVPGLAVIHEEEFGGAYLDMTIEDFNALGFAYGDSVDIAFSNGYRLEGVPYYNGYYTRNGDALLVAYPGYPYIKACINNGDDLWEIAGLAEGDTAEITLSAGEAYLDIQNARALEYKDDRALFDSDAQFANFRAVRAGNIRENALYRSASPCDNPHNRAPYVDGLIAAAGVNCILNLSDNDEKIARYIAAEDFHSQYFLGLYERGGVIPLALNMNFASDDFRGKIVAGFTAMAEHEGPYLVHCTEGKDRTGFVCMLLEALCGATYREIVDDYMITYYNYYWIAEESDPARYGVIVENLLLPMVQSVMGEETDPAEADLAACARQYLLDAGMDEAYVDALKAALEE